MGANALAIQAHSSANSPHATTQGCYVHIPFCARKCAYCDFNSYSGYGDDSVAKYLVAIEREIRATPISGDPVDTIFFGGGTPTAIPAHSEARILRAVLDTLPVTSDAEITTEANPGSADVAGLAVIREAGFNRISFGVQSFDPGLLIALGRIHSADEARQAVRAARDAGFDNVSIDLMFGLPGQTLVQWRDTLNEAFDLGVDHLSMYSLIVEEGTGFAVMARKGMLNLPPDDLAADMFEAARLAAVGAGFAQYEISNYAKSGRQCRHNMHYWRNDAYHGFGAGAVSYQDGVRATRILTPGRYATAVATDSDIICDAESPDIDTQRFETMMLGLRLTDEGVDCERFAHRFGADPRAFWAGTINRYEGLGLLEQVGVSLRLTSKGVFLGSEVMAAFL